MSEQYPWLFVGAKVVCIGMEDPAEMKGRLAKGGAKVERNRVYTIRGIAVIAGHLGVHLAEIINPAGLYEGGVFEPYYFAAAFRPVQTRSTDAGLAILRKIDADVFQNDGIPA